MIKMNDDIRNAVKRIYEVYRNKNTVVNQFSIDVVNITKYMIENDPVLKDWERNLPE